MVEKIEHVGSGSEGERKRWQLYFWQHEMCFA